MEKQECLDLFQLGSVKEALNACNNVLQRDSENLDALIDRAEAHIADEDYDKGKLFLMYHPHTPSHQREKSCCMVVYCQFFL